MDIERPVPIAATDTAPVAGVAPTPDAASGAFAGVALDAAMMRRALDLAARAAGRTNPNPLVGAVIVRDGRVIGEGYHACYGEAHAERRALVDCARRGEDPRGATVYVTLEPCSHHGHQPPCADALVEAGVARVVVGSRDPNPLVAGRGVARLRAAGVRVDCDVLRAECDAINQVFFHYITTRTPYVVAKWAMTADGRIACASGDSRWVTGPAARTDAHALRNRLAAVMVGAGTVAADDPALTCRVAGGRNPLRVVCDTGLSLAPDSCLVRTLDQAPLLVACSQVRLESDPSVAEKAARLRELGVEILPLPETSEVATPHATAAGSPAGAVAACSVPASTAGRVDLHALMVELGRRDVDSVLLEGGARLHAAAFAAGVVNEVVAYLAPKVVGGVGAPGPVAGEGAALMADALPLGAPHVSACGDDVRICWRAGATPKERALPCVACGPLSTESAGE